MSAERLAVLDALRIVEEAGPKDIAEATGRSEGAVKMMLATLCKEGLVKRISRGKYPYFDLMTLNGESKEVR